MKRFAFQGTCVYAIVNVKTGRRYIGSTANFQNRVQTHRFHLRRGSHVNRHLQGSWKKHGEDSFVFGVVEEVSIGLMIEREQWHLDASQPNVYNIGLVAASPSRGRKFNSPMKGTKVSVETRKAMSDAVTRRWKERPFEEFPEEVKQRWRARNIESRARSSASNTGQKRSDHTKSLLRAAWVRRKGEEAAADALPLWT